MTENILEPKQSHFAIFTLENKGNEPLSSDWEIYFNTIFLLVQPQSKDSKITFEHISGDFFRIKPNKGFLPLGPGESYSFGYSSDNFLVKNSHRPHGDRVEIIASSPKGAFYGIHSFMGLLPIPVFSTPANELVLPKIQIRDEPRFAYRGLFLDVARNFQSKESVL